MKQLCKINITWVLAIFLIGLNGCIYKKMELSSEMQAEIRSEISLTFNELANSAKSLDVDKYLAFFDHKMFTSLNQDGSVFHTLTDFISPYKEQISHIKRYTNLEFQKIKITVINKTAVVLVNEYQATVVLNSGDEVTASGAGTQVWSKTSGQWKLVHVSSSAKK